jgi:carbon-monoxide dehydrogenase catalytic subunit
MDIAGCTRPLAFRICSIGNETLMRKGVKAAGSMVQQELAIVTVAVDAMVIDIQCVIPNVQRVAEKFHTQIITTNPHAKIVGVPVYNHTEFDPAKADSIAEEIVQRAFNSYNGSCYSYNGKTYCYPGRDTSKVHIPIESPKDIMAGFSVEQIVGALSRLLSALFF